MSFTTGPNPSGYKLTRVDFRMLGGSGTAPTYAVSVHQDSSSSPGTSLGTLTNPASWPSSAGYAQHDAPSGGIDLAASTTYWLVFDITANPSSSVTEFLSYWKSSDFEDTDTWTGWSIGNGTRWRAWSNTAWNALGTTSLLVRIHGHAVSPPLVSTLGQTSNPGLQGGSGNHFFSNDLAQAFTTGSHSEGYKLTRMDLRLKSSAATQPVYSVSVHKDSSDRPGDSLGTLTTSSSLSSSYARVQFAASGDGIRLDAGTKYWVVLDVSTGGSDSHVQVLVSNDEDSGGPAGWSVANAYRFRPNAGSTWTGQSNNVLGLAVWGDEIHPLMVSNTGPGGVTQESLFTVDFAQNFTTGSGTGGYKLTRVALRLKSSATTTPVFSVSVQGDSSGLPDGTSLGTLTGSATLTSSWALVEFAASGSGISLSADTDYWVVVDVSTGDDDSAIAIKGGIGQNNEDAGGLPGWSIGNDPYSRNQDNTGNWSAVSAGPIQIEVRGTSVDQTKPAFQSATVSGTSLAVTFSEDLDSGSRPPGTAFVLSGGRSGTGTAAISGATVSVTLGSGVPFGETVTVSYSPPASSKLRDNAGILAKSFSGQPVANNAPQPVTPPPPPVPDPPNPEGQRSSTPIRLEPQPLQLALWTDKPGYLPGETIRLYRTLDPHQDCGRFRAFLYLVRAGDSELLTVAPLSAEGQLHDGAVDHLGLPEGTEVFGFHAASLAAERELTYQGIVPGLGVWQFVLELRSGPDCADEERGVSLGTRRAWAPFVVAERSQLLNRSGVDREIRSDMTLHSHTVYYLFHQLFVHDGATLTIEPGTLVLAWGRNAAIIVEPGGRIVAEGTRDAPVVLTCGLSVGLREPGCWGGLRILGRAPGTRPVGTVPGVLPPIARAFGGIEAEGSSGVLRYVRVEFAGAGGEPDAPAPAIGLYGVGSGTVLDHVQAHASLGDGFAFHGGAAICSHCVASGSGEAGLSWDHGWRGGASHLYVQHGEEGLHGLDGGSDEEGPDREPRSLPALSNVTLVHASLLSGPRREAVGMRLRSGSGVFARDLLVTGFDRGAIEAGDRSALLFWDGESWVSSALLYRNGPFLERRQLRGGLDAGVDLIDEDPKLEDVRWFASPDPRPKLDSPALPDDREGYIGAFDREENWLEGWTLFGPESVYDLRWRSDDAN